MEENNKKNQAEETVEETAKVQEDFTEDVAKQEEAAEDTVESSETEKEASKEKSKKFKKKKDPRDEKIEELSDKLLRQMAEFDNFRRRTEKEKSSMYVIGAKDIIEKLLPVVDNFERGLSAVPEEQKQDGFTVGMEMVYKQLMTMLGSAGVQTIEAVGSEFNPDLHNAVMHVDDDSVGENIVVEEFQKGYTYKDSVVRHSMVKVAN